MHPLLALTTAVVVANMPPPPVRKAQPAPPAVVATLTPVAQGTPESKAFAKKLNDDLLKLYVRSSTAEWLKATYITDDSERNAAAMNEDLMAYTGQAIKESLKFKGQPLDPDTARFIYLLRVSQALPAPADAAKRSELATLAAKLEGLYGKGKWCGKGYVPGKDAGEGQEAVQGPRPAVRRADQGRHLRRAARGLGRLARDLQGDAPALRAPGAAVERGRDGDRHR